MTMMTTSDTRITIQGETFTMGALRAAFGRQGTPDQMVEARARQAARLGLPFFSEAERTERAERVRVRAAYLRDLRWAYDDHVRGTRHQSGACSEPRWSCRSFEDWHEFDSWPDSIKRALYGGEW